jgi:uncharacterized protein (TIGR02118 family)
LSVSWFPGFDASEDLIIINAVSLLKRRADLSVEAFQHHWRYDHAKLIARLPGVRRYAQSHPLDECYRGEQPPYDGIAELWAADSQAFRDIAASDAYAAVQADEQKFLERAAIALVLTDEHVMVDGPVAADSVKRIRLLNRRSDLTAEAFQSYWRDRYGPLIAGLPGLERYVQYHARPGAYGRDRQPAYDGFDVSWFASMDALRDAIDSDACDQAHREQGNFLARGNCPQVLTREYLIIE